MSATRAADRIVRGPKTAVFVALGALLLLSACKRADEVAAPEIRPVRVTTIESRATNGVVSLTGTVQAQTEINLAFRIDGRLIDRSVDIGDTVKPGQLIARLDSQNEETSVLSARAQLAAARAQLVEARNNHARMRDLVAESAVSRATFDQAVAMLKTAESQVDSVQAQLTLALNRLSYTRLVSEVAGVVTARGPEPGEVVSAGRMIVQVAREGARDAVFGVPAQLKDIAPKNPEIRVVLTSDPSISAIGRVREVSPRADAHLRGAGSPDRPACRNAAGQHGHGFRESGRHQRHRDSGLGAHAFGWYSRGLGRRPAGDDGVTATR